MYQELIQKNTILISIILFLILFGIIQLMKPSFLYNEDGSIREFGIGYRNKTILPVWLLSIILGILCYVTILFYSRNSKL
jgi:Zn-dependent protease with chaperone function